MVTINEKNEICEVVAPQKTEVVAPQPKKKQPKHNRFTPKKVVCDLPFEDIDGCYEFESFYEKEVGDYYSNDPEDWLKASMKEFLTEYDDPRILDLFAKNVDFIKDVLKHPASLYENIDILHEPIFDRAHTLNHGSLVKRKLPKFWTALHQFQQHQKVYVRRCKCERITKDEGVEHKHVCKECKAISFHAGPNKCDLKICASPKCGLFKQSPFIRLFKPCYTWEKCPVETFSAILPWTVKHLKACLERECSLFFNFIPTTLRNYFASRISSPMLDWNSNKAKEQRIAIPEILCPHETLLKKQKDIVISEFRDKFIKSRSAGKYMVAAMEQISKRSWATELRKVTPTSPKVWHIPEASILAAFPPWPRTQFDECEPIKKKEIRKIKSEKKRKTKLVEQIKKLKALRIGLSDDYYMNKAKCDYEDDPEVVQFTYEGDEQLLRQQRKKEFKLRKRLDLEAIKDQTLQTALKMIGSLQKQLKYDPSVKPADVNMFSIDQGYIFRFGKAICALDDPDRCKKILENVRENIGSSVNIMQSDVLSPFKDYMTQMVSQYVKADTMFQSAIVARLMAFLLSMVSSITGLISNIRGSNPSTFETFIHVMAIVAMLTDMVLSIITITRLQGRGKQEFSKAEVLNQEQVLNTVLKFVSQYTSIDSTEIKNLVDFENLIVTPLKSEIEMMKDDTPLIRPIRRVVKKPYLSTYTKESDYNSIFVLQDYQRLWLTVQTDIDAFVQKQECAHGFNASVKEILTPPCACGLNNKIPDSTTPYRDSLPEFATKIKYGIHDAESFIKGVAEDRTKIVPIEFLQYINFCEHYFIKCVQSGTYLGENATITAMANNLRSIVRNYNPQKTIFDIGNCLRAQMLVFKYTELCPNPDFAEEVRGHRFDVVPACNAITISKESIMVLDFGQSINVAQSFPWDTTIAFITTLAGLGICIADYATGKTGEKAWAKKICLGSNLMTSLKTSVKDSRRLTEDLAYDFFGYQIGTAHYVKTRGSELCSELTTYVNLSSSEYAINLPKYFKFLSCIDTCKEFQKSLTQSSKDLSVGETNIITTLSQLLASASGKISSLKETFDSLTVRQETQFLLLFGAEGSGKTYFATSYLIPKICEKMGLPNMSYKYKVKGGGTPFFETYAGQTVGITDELWKNGAYDPLNLYLNETLSQAPQNLEGAFIKNNPNLLKMLIACSNKCFFEVFEPDGSGFSRDFAKALFSRGTCVRVINKNQYDSDAFLNLPRDKIKHTDTFEELTFIEYYIPGVDPYERRRIIQGLVSPPKLGKSNGATIDETTGALTEVVLPANQRAHEHQKWYYVKTPEGTQMAFQTYSPEQLADKCITMIEAARVNYVNTLKSNAEKHIRSKYNLDKHYSLENAIKELSLMGVSEDIVRDKYKAIVPSVTQSGANSTNHFISFTSGFSGQGKTYTWEKFIIPELQNAMPHLKHYNIKTVEDAMKVKTPSIISIDDMVSRNQGKDYMDIMEKLPSPSFISIRENIYWKRKKVSRMNLVQSGNNMQDAPWYLRVPQLFGTSMLSVTMMVPCKIKDGTETYLSGMEEGWYRRLGIPNYVGSYSQYQKLRQRDLARNVRMYAPLLTIAALTYFSWFAPLLLIPFLALCTFCSEYIYGPTISLPFQNEDRTLLYEHVYGGLGTLVGNKDVQLDALDIPRIAFERYRTAKNVLSEIRISESMGHVAKQTADVYIEAPTIVELPPFINDGSRCISMAIHGRNIDGYRIAIQNKVLQAQFPTCVGDFYLKENPSHAEVVELARKTYSKLLTASADATVCVKCSDFEAYGSEGVIKYWLSKNGSGTVWTCDLPTGKAGEENRVTFRKFQNLQEEKSFSLTTDELAAIFSGELLNNPNMSIEEMKVVWQYKTRIITSAPYDFSHAIATMQTSSGNEIIKQLKDAEVAYENICTSVSFTVISCMVALVSVGSIATLLYMLLRQRKNVKPKQNDIASFITEFPDVPINFKTRDIFFVGTANLKLDNIYTILVKITGTQYGSGTIDINDPQIKLQVRQLIEHQIRLYSRSVNNADLKQYDYKLLMIHADENRVESNVDRTLTNVSTMLPIDKDKLAFSPPECLYITHVQLEEQRFPNETPCDRISFTIDVDEDDQYMGSMGHYSVTVYDDPTAKPHYQFYFKGEKYVEDYTYLYGELLKPLGDYFMQLYESTQEASDDSFNKKKGKSKSRRAVGRMQNILKDNELMIISEPDLVGNKKPHELKSKKRSVKVQTTENINHVPPIVAPIEAMEVPYEKICANRVRISNYTTGAEQYGLVLWDNYILANHHSFYQTETLQDDSIEAFFDPMCENAPVTSFCEIVWTDSINDLTLLRMTNPHVPYFKDITKYLIRSDQIEHITSGYMIKHGAVDNRVWASMRIIRENVHLPYINSSSGVQKIHEGEVVEALFTESGLYTQPGDCGSPYIGKVRNGNDFRLLGIHMMGNPSGTAHGILVTAEMVAKMKRHIKGIPEVVYVCENAPIVKSELAKAPKGLVESQKVRDVYMDTEILDIITTSREQHIVPKQEWPIFRPNELHYGETKDSNLTYLGCTDKFKPSWDVKPSHFPSYFVNLLEKEGLECNVYNSICDPYEVEDPSLLLRSTAGAPSIIYSQVAKYNDPIKLDPVVLEILHEAVEEMKPLYLEWYGSKDHRLLTEVEVINGLYERHDSLYSGLDGIDLKASPGYFAVTHKNAMRKSLIYERNLVWEANSMSDRYLYSYASHPLGQLMANRFRAKIHLAGAGDWFVACAKDSLKDELVTEQKARIGKTRLFVGMDDADVNFQRFVCGTFAAAVKLNHRRAPCQVGIDPYLEFHHLASRFQKISNLSEAGDYKNWDKHIIKEFISAMISVIEYVITYHASNIEKKRMQKYLRIIELDTYNTVSNCDGIFYQKHRGIPSGLFLTAVGNSIVNDFYHVVVCKLIIHEYNMRIPKHLKNRDALPSHIEFIRQISDWADYGDDFISVIHKDYAHVIDFMKKREAFERYLGIEYTDPQKGEEIYTLKLIEHQEFLSRKFSRRKNGIIVPALKEKSILGMMFYTTGMQTDVVENTLQNLRNEIRYLEPAEYEKYSRLYHLMLDYWKKVHNPSSKLMYLPLYDVNLQGVTNSIITSRV